MVSEKLKADTRSTAKVAETRPRGSSAREDQSVAELRAENEDLRRNSQYRSQFLSRLAHELRTPLTSILGFSEILLSQEKLTDAQRGFCERIQSSGHQLQASLNQLSDLARLDAPHAKVSPQPISIGEVLREVAPALGRALEKKRAKLSCDAGDDLPTIMSDRPRLRLVIYNVLSYAISRTPERATVFADAAATDDGVSITVRDSGELFDDPAKIAILDLDDNSPAGDLGLSIALQNIQILGGTIRARNLTDGVELILTLPFDLPQ